MYLQQVDILTGLWPFAQSGWAKRMDDFHLAYIFTPIPGHTGLCPFGIFNLVFFAVMSLNLWGVIKSSVVIIIFHQSRWFYH